MGYFIELPKSQEKKLDDTFILRQSLRQVVRFSSKELQVFWETLQGALESIQKRQDDILYNLCNSVIWHNWYLLELSRSIALLDFYTNAAYISLSKGYIRPEISNTYECHISWWEHPVISDIHRDFVKNDLELSRSNTVHVITGPNMWWKSTFLRQNALIILMAHMWMNIPAVWAKIWVLDSIFSRVWAGDNLFLGQSTFMVEMQEISYILRHASKKSFIIIDEIGRGTSTHDGMSLAWSILEYIHNIIWAKTLFATHYHEIIDKVDMLPRAHNFSVAVGENENNIVFLRKIIPGWIKKSYGLHVAELSGIPREIISQAQDFLQHLDRQVQKRYSSQMSLDITSMQSSQEIYKQKILDDIRNIDTNNITPLEALHALISFQQEIKKSK